MMICKLLRKVGVPFFVIALVFCMSSCCTLLSGDRNFYVDAKPYGSQVYIGKKYVGNTPCHVKVKHTSKPITIKTPYGDKQLKVESSFDHRVWCNLFWLGWAPVAFITDFSTGNHRKLIYSGYEVDYRPDNVKHQEELAIQEKKRKEAEEVRQRELAAKRAEEARRQEETRAAKAREQMPTQSLLARISTSSKTKVLTSKDIYAQCNPAVFTVYTADNQSQYQGSGFVVSKDGIAISNYHVFKGTTIGKESIVTSNGMKYKIAEVLACSEINDFIVFKLANYNGPYISITKRGYDVGDEVYAIGSPINFKNTISQGIISSDRGNYHIQITAPIDHGSSGGALINKYGEVIGITSAGVDGTQANINFAIDIRVLFHMVNTRF